MTTRRHGSATQHRDLRTGTPVWPRPRTALDRPTPLDANVVTDVVVVGGGVTGALVTDGLLRAGLRVVVVDRRGWARGSTAASTALLQFDLDQPLIHLRRKLGLDAAARAYTRSAAAVDYLRGRVTDLGLRCGLRERHAVYLPGNVLDARGLAAEARARDAIGLRSQLLDRAALRALTTIDRLAAIGPIPGARNCHVVMGFGGNGITFAAVAAQYLQRTLTGLTDPDVDLFPVP